MSHRVSLQVFQNAVKLQLVLFAETGTLEAAHQAVLDKYKGRIIAVRIPLTESGVASWFGVNSANHPAAFLVDTKQPNNYLRYKLDDGSAVTEASMAQFVDDYFAGKLSTHSKSAPKPSEIDVPRTVVASTFKEIVLDTTKDVFLEFYAPWCGHCKNLAPVWKEFAEKHQGESDLVIAHIDATANDTPKDAGVSVSGFPTLVWFPKSGVPEKYEEGDRSLEALEKFLADRRN